MSVIDEVKQRADIVEVVSQYTKLSKSGRTFRALCPFHSEKHPSFFVYPEQQSWHCFGACNTGGDVFSFIMRKEGIEFGEALRLLAQRVGVAIPSRSGPEAGRDERERLYQANQAAAQYFHNLLLSAREGEAARHYLASRGFSSKTVADFQLGFSLNSWEGLKQYLMERGYTEGELLAAGLVIEAEGGKTHDRFRNRLMFPISDAQGRVIGFGARVLDDSLPKYINSPQTSLFDKSGTLYGLDRAKPAIRQRDVVVIVEGYMDVITAHQNGFSNVVASMGTAITEKQVSALKRLTRNIALALDADAAGEEAMLRCVGYENMLDAEVRVVILPPGRDPDDMIKEDAQAWQRLLEAALPVVDYTFDMVVSGLDLTAARDKTLAVGRLLPIIAEIKDSVRQAHYLQKLARLVKVSERNLEAALAKIRSGTRYQAREPKTEAVNRVLQPLVSSSLEEYCLALLLRHPELRHSSQALSPEYFQNSENREIFSAWQKAGDLASLKDRLDVTIHEHLERLMTRRLLDTQVEQRYNNCVLRLREEFLKGLERKREAMFALEAETKGSGADLARLKEEGVEVSIELAKVFAKRRQKRSVSRG